MMMERLESPPPEKIFKMPKNWLLERNRFKARVSIPGIGIAASKRKTANAKRTKRTLLRKVLSVQTNLTLFQKFCIFYFILIFFPLIHKRFRMAENFSRLPSFPATSLSLRMTRGRSIDLKLYPRFFGNFFIISRSSGRRLLPARAVCPLPPRPEVLACLPPRPTVRSFLFLCCLFKLCICILFFFPACIAMRSIVGRFFNFRDDDPLIDNNGFRN